MIVEQVSQDLIAALKSGQKPKAEALRLLKSAFTNQRINLGHELNDEEATKVIKKEIKSRIEARDLFQNNNRQEQAIQEEFERAVYAEYVPAELTDDQILAIVKNVIESKGKDAAFGMLMGEAIKKVAGQADGSRVSKILKENL
jgi:uncharacterized protein YqeY